MISFNIPPYIGDEDASVLEAIHSQKISGDGQFTKRCQQWIESALGAKKALLTTSCSDALELSALLIDVQPGDEIIMPAYTFVSTANAFALRGGVPVFVDIDPYTMNLDAGLIEAAITDRTRAIVPVHYAGVGCDMRMILRLAQKYNLKVIEDAAQGVTSYYEQQALGTFGNFGCFSFHETKNYSMGEGGAILIQNEEDIDRAEIIREKGTNRSQFWRGMVDKYTWVSVGSSFLPSELNAAYLLPQLIKSEMIRSDRLRSWATYAEILQPLADEGLIELPFIPDECSHNAHMFYIKAKDLDERTRLIRFLKENGVESVFHYIPLHTSPAGKSLGRFHGEDRFTTRESERILRLPMYFRLAQSDIEKVCDMIGSFYHGMA